MTMQAHILQTRDVIDDRPQPKTHMEICVDGLAEARAKGDERVVDFWERSIAALNGRE